MSSELSANLVALNTIVYREVRRFTRIWPQTLLPPAITMVLYFVIFGNLIGRQIGDMGGFTYMEYIVPGLIMMSVITNAYGNVVSSFFGSKFQRSVEELLVSPVSPHTILLGYTIGGVLRGLAVGVIVTMLSLSSPSCRCTTWASRCWWWCLPRPFSPWAVSSTRCSRATSTTSRSSRPSC